MRRLLRQWLAIPILALALAGVVALSIGRPYARAASLVVRAASLEHSHPTIGALARQDFVERGLPVTTRTGTLRAKVYQPAHPTGPAVLLVPGINAMGIDEPRLIGFARQLAATGLTIVTPEVPDLKRYAVTPRSTDEIEDSTGWLAGEAGLSRGKKVGLIGISFAGGLSIVAAGRPSIADRLAFVLSFGGHGDFQRVVRFLCTGLEPDVGGTAGPGRLPAGTISASVGRRSPHDYGTAVMALDLADQLVPTEQVGPLRQAILLFLEASHLALYDASSAEREFEKARGFEVTLPEPAATVLHLVNSRDVSALGARLLPFVAALGDDSALSPERSPAPHAPVFLLHGSDDNVIPAAESRALAHHLDATCRVWLLLSPLITHAEVNKAPRSSDILRLIGFWASVLRQ